MKSFNITILFFFIISLNTKAQYLQDISGKPLSFKAYTDVIGNPYLYDYWSDGSVVTKGGVTHDKLALKYDIVKDEIYFMADKNIPMAFVDSIKTFVLDKVTGKEIFTNGFPEVDNFDNKSFYQVLFKGSDVLLLFKASKYITETKAYGSATTEKKFNENNSYYLYKDGKMEKFKPSKKEFLQIFKDQGAQVETFLKKENIDFKNNLDLVKVFDFYYALK
ncbi:hypothetical protein I5M32_03475 [Pedobacter sp. SD-b]|uniref:DKNYY family protein n=1 Tax=Pedobacter segetis TaxID=2793069 RepID=A0ABS1BGL7_9SPHI|nr:hypothetical protein [Pedobacter segetis]MBK0382009.1 hypothetical protein [Pedobacter segetis]